MGQVNGNVLVKTLWDVVVTLPGVVGNRRVGSAAEERSPNLRVLICSEACSVLGMLDFSL